MQNNFNSVIPLLPASNIAETVAYYEKVLGYNVSQTGDYWGSALRGKANFYFSKAEGEIAPVTSFVFVDEVDNLCTAFRTQGATIIEEPENKPWGFRQFTLQDINGHRFNYFRFADGVE